MDCLGSAGVLSDSASEPVSPYELLLQAAFLIPISHYLIGSILIFLLFLYDLFEIHFFRDLLTGFRGQSVSLIFNSASHVYQEVASKCKILHSRYLPTFWLCSPHLQTAFLTFFGRPPVCNYKRQLFHLSDGGTIALDWLMHTDVMKPVIHVSDEASDKNPIVVVVPGLTSDSNSQYVRHIAFKMAKRGWNVVISNHRGLGGVSITSDYFYNAGWTDDIRKVVDYLHCHYPEAPLFAVGTSIGANVLVKYLGEDKGNIPIIGAAAICSTWDLLICDRFICRRFVQRLYDKALTFGLRGYAELHQNIFSRLTDWEGIARSRTVRDFDHHATRVVGKFETVDTYYRRCSSAGYVGNVTIPLLCISALDDPVCTREAIPWDECRVNKNVILATTQHGGHLAYFEGITAKSIWWVRAVDEFLYQLYSSPLIHREKEVQATSTNPLDSSIDQAPYVNFAKEGMVTALGNDAVTHVDQLTDEAQSSKKPEITTTIADEKEKDQIEAQSSKPETTTTIADKKNKDQINAPGETTSQSRLSDDVPNVQTKQLINQLSRFNRNSMWLLAYVAIVTTCPIVGSALFWFFRKKYKKPVVKHI